MGVRLRVSPQTLALLDAFLARPPHWRHGYSLAQDTEIASGTLYPILMRLENLHWLETKWESSVVGRPRHLYRLTSNGRAWAREELANARARKLWKTSSAEA